MPECWRPAWRLLSNLMSLISHLWLVVLGLKKKKWMSQSDYPKWLKFRKHVAVPIVSNCAMAVIFWGRGISSSSNGGIFEVWAAETGGGGQNDGIALEACHTNKNERSLRGSRFFWPNLSVCCISFHGLKQILSSVMRQASRLGASRFQRRIFGSKLEVAESFMGCWHLILVNILLCFPNCKEVRAPMIPEVRKLETAWNGLKQRVFLILFESKWTPFEQLNKQRFHRCRGLL